MSRKGISMSVLPYFNAAAERLIEERGAVEVVSAALVYTSGMTSNELYINTEINPC